jgi:hypothetical protein
MNSKQFPKDIFVFFARVTADTEMPPSAEAIAIVLAQHFIETEHGAARPACQTIADATTGYIEAVAIYAHGDKAGHDGARKLAAALSRRGIETFVDGLQ